MSKLVLIMISYLFPLVVLLYLYLFHKISNKMQSEYKEYWQTIGNPSKYDLFGQVRTVNLIIFGKTLPEYVSSKYKKDFLILRIILFIGIINFILIIFMILFGQYN